MSKILWVNGEPGTAPALEGALARRGHQITTAHSVETALAQITAESPDLVILDILLPDTTGMDAFRAIQRPHPKLPVIILADKSTLHAAIEATQIGAFDYRGPNRCHRAGPRRIGHGQGAGRPDHLRAQCPQ